MANWGFFLDLLSVKQTEIWRYILKIFHLSRSVRKKNLEKLRHCKKSWVLDKFEFFVLIDRNWYEEKAARMKQFKLREFFEIPLKVLTFNFVFAENQMEKMSDSKWCLVSERTVTSC